MNKQYLKLVIGICATLVYLIAFKFFIADVYYIPTNSMENTIARRSYAIVLKATYGAKLPSTTYEIPFLSRVLKKYPPKELWKHTRMYGYNKIKRNDIVLAKYNNTKIIKRVIGVPKDTVKIKNGIVLINSENENVLDSYNYAFTASFSKGQIDTIQKVTRLTFIGDDTYNITLNGKYLKKFLAENINVVAQNRDTIYHQKVFPKAMNGIWTENEYGPLVVPYNGMKIHLNQKNFDLYNEVLYKYEDKKITRKDNGFFINGEKVSCITFSNDYFFVMGDNRMNSIDSRFIGFLPKQKILGKVSYWFKS